MNVVGAYATSKNVGLTANNNTIYGLSAIDLSKGPVVIESPLGAYGCIDDWWQRPDKTFFDKIWKMPDAEEVK